MSEPYINIPPYYDRPKQAGELWSLQKDGRCAACHLWTHPVGGEIRVSVDGDLIRSEARQDGLALVDLGLEWKAQFPAEGMALRNAVDGHVEGRA